MTQLPIAGGNGELEPVEIVHPPQKVGHHLLKYWIDRQPLTPAQVDIAKNGRIAQAIAREYTVEQIFYALQGIDQIFPYSEQGWNLVILRRHFDRAMQIGYAGGNVQKQVQSEAFVRHIRNRHD